VTKTRPWLLQSEVLLLPIFPLAFVASLDMSYLEMVVLSSPVLVAVACIVGLVALYSGLKYYRPVILSGSPRSGLTLLAISVAVYVISSYFGAVALHWFVLLGMYLGLVMTIGGRSQALPVAPSLLAFGVLSVPAVVQGPVGVLLSGAVLGSASVFAFARRKGSKANQTPCVFCAFLSSEDSDSCSFCGRWFGELGASFKNTRIALFVTLSLALMLLSAISIPVIEANSTGFEYSTISISGANRGVPLYAGPPLVLVNQSTALYPGLGTVNLVSLIGPSGPLTLWIISSGFSLRQAQLSIIFPGIGLNSSTPSSTKAVLPVYSWTYGNQSYVGYLGGTQILTVGGGTTSSRYLSYVVGKQSPENSKETLAAAEQIAIAVGSHLLEAQKYDFWLGLATIPASYEVYLEAASGVAVLFAALFVVRSRDLKSSMRIENSEVLEGTDFEIFASLSSTKIEATGQDILGIARERHYTQEWTVLLAKLKLFETLGLVETRLRVRNGVPIMKWSFRIR